MRLQLTVLLLLVGPGALAQQPVRTVLKVNYYADNDGNDVITPLTSVEGDIGSVVTVRAHAALDIMTCASVDVVSAASPKGYFQETRQEYEGGATVKLGPTTLSGTATWSRENDYHSFSGGLGFSAELFQKNTTLTLGYGYTGSVVGRSGDPNFEKDLTSHTITASVSQVLGRRLLGQVGWFVSLLGGFQESPYRMAELSDGTFTPESAPDDRTRQSVVLRLRGALSPTWFLGGDYRFYFDTWGIDAHTVQVALENEASSWFEWRLRTRIYRQSPADFYADVYDAMHEFMTADRELGGLWSALVGVKLDFRVPGLGEALDLAFDLKSDLTYQAFDDFRQLPERWMVVTEAGVHIDF